MPKSPGDVPLKPIIEPDGSVRYPGFVITPDGTDAAADERKQPPIRNQSQRVFVPSNDELTQQASQQVRSYLDAPIPDYRPSSAVAGAPSEQPEQYGRVVTVQANSTTTGVWTPLKKREENWMVLIQPENILFDGSDLTGILITMTWMVGGATFIKEWVISKAALYRMPVNARKVQIDLAGINVSDPTFGNKKLQVAVAIGCGNDNFVQALSGVWYPFDSLGAALADQYVLLPQSPLDSFQSTPISKGYLMSAVVIAQSLSASPLYPMFFDLDGTNPANFPLVATTVPFLVGTPLQNPGDVASLDDEFSTTWAFQRGLVFGLSATADQYTAPAAGSLVRVDFKVGV